MSSESESENLTPPEIRIIADETNKNLLPQKSKKKYEMSYDLFMKWKAKYNTNSFSENILLAYFKYLSETQKSSTLWCTYSKIKTMLELNHDIRIQEYAKLKAFLRRQSEGYIPKKSKIFTTEEINKFIKNAADDIHLVTKVALIMSLMGACRANELHSMTLNDIEDFENYLIINIPNTKTKVPRTFTVTGDFYEVCKKYLSLRPTNATLPYFFLNYQRGKVTCQRIGINKFGHMGKLITNYLGLPDAEKYTGHCFRRSSATVLVDAGADITALKRHGGWKSTTVAEGYIDNSLKNKLDTAQKITRSIQQSENQSNDEIIGERTNTITINKNEAVAHSSHSPLISFTNCSNVSHITINIQKD